MKKEELEKRIKELEKENDNLNIRLLRGDIVKLEEKGIAFSYNGKVARVTLCVSSKKIRINSDENTICIIPESNRSFNIEFI